MEREEVEPVHCRAWTRARRHPHVIGVIAGWVSPWPSTAAQLAALLGSAILLIRTHHWWGPVLPGIFDALVIFGVPAYCWWAARYLEIEGRTPIFAALGFVSYFTRPRSGSLDGRAYRPRSYRVDGGTFYCWTTR